MAARRNPFKDITDTVTNPAVSPSPIRNPRRKAKAPTRTLAARLRASKNPTFLSSLPPSSPPLLSSRLSELEPEHEESVNTLNFPTSVNDSNPDPGNQLQDDVDWNIQEATADEQLAPELDVANMSDPFGFFAVEKKLKAQRTANPSNSNHTSRPRYRVAPPPPINTTLPESLPSFPPTPRKRPGKRRAIASPTRSSPGIFNPRTSSLPSTPSPSKLVKNKGKAKSTDIHGGSGEEIEPRDEADEVLVKSGNARAKRRQVKKPRGSGSANTYQVSARSSDSPLVKRTTRQSTAAKKLSTKAPNEGEEVTVGRKKPASTRIEKSISTTSGKVRKRGKGKAKEKGSEHSDVDTQEKWERERQIRLEYFRKLEDYKIEKENVYII